MVELLVGIIAVAVLLGIALLIEESRDWIIETFEYIFTFEWFDDIREFFSTIFEGISEFSIYGVVFGALTTIALYFLSDWTLQPFLQYYSPSGQIIWGAITYIGTFFAGYMMGVYYENSG